MDSLSISRILVRVNNVLTNINVAVVSILIILPIFGNRKRPVRIPLAANVGLAIFLTIILAMLIMRSVGSDPETNTLGIY